MSFRRRQRSKQHHAAHAGETESAPPLAHPLVPAGEAELIASETDLAAALKHVRSHEAFAFDTEFIGEVAYFPRTCLVQLATSQRVMLIDPIAVPDLRPVWDLLGEVERTAIVHAGASDLSPVRRHLGRDPGCVVDVQVAAGFAGMAYPSSLQKLVERFAGYPLAKGHTFTDWDARPLSASQLRYAADDVRYLPLVWNELRTTLEPQRLDWARRETMARLEDPHVFDSASHARRASRGYELDRQQESLLDALCRARDTIARAEDLPHRATVPDAALLDIVRLRPGTRAELVAIRGLPRPVVARHGDLLLGVLAQHPSNPVEWFKVRRRREDEPSARGRIDAMLAAAQVACAELGIPLSLTLTRSDLERYSRRCMAAAERAEPAPPLFASDDWRSEALGSRIESID